MEHNNYVGILVSDLFYRKIPFGRTYPEQISFYEESCAQYGMKPCYLRIRDLRTGIGYISAYISNNGDYQKHRIPVPQVIHNRTIIRKKSALSAVERLEQRGVRVFNLRNRYSKLHIHRLLQDNPDIHPYLPETLEATLENINKLRKKYPAILVKPVNSSIGKGIMKIQLISDGCWELKYRHARTNKWMVSRFTAQLPIVLRKRIRSQIYMVQQLLPLATYKSCPFDLRVSVQRGENGMWQVTGIVGKVARRGAFLTNVAQGGTALPLDVLLREYPLLDPGQVAEIVAQASLTIAVYLGTCLPGLADLGLDMGITREGDPLFIEANGRDQRYSFREAGMIEEWKATYRNPMAYASFLSNIYKSP